VRRQHHLQRRRYLGQKLYFGLWPCSVSEHQKAGKIVKKPKIHQPKTTDFRHKLKQDPTNLIHTPPMKTTLLTFLTFVLLFTSCMSTQGVTVDDSEYSEYIFDYQSRLSQAKLRKIKGGTSAIKFGAVALALFADVALAAAESDKDKNNNDNTTNNNNDESRSYLTTSALSISSGIHNLRIENRSKYAIRFDYLTDQAIDADSNLSIKNINLPAGKSIKVLVQDDAIYQLRIWNSQTEDVRLRVFTGTLRGTSFDGNYVNLY
jgi:hypothetical protein